MTDYTIAAIPTLYNGRQYRSRLEAKWAAFFDLLGWPHEYEPFDLGKWSPDFRILSQEGVSALVEVKPIDQEDEAVTQRMTEAANAAGFTGPLLLLGNCPDFSREIPEIGWMPHRGLCWGSAMLVWIIDPYAPRFAADILEFSDDPTLWGGIFTRATGSIVSATELYGYREHSSLLWARACNAVQWRPEE